MGYIATAAVLNCLKYVINRHDKDYPSLGLISRVNDRFTIVCSSIFFFNVRIYYLYSITFHIKKIGIWPYVPFNCNIGLIGWLHIVPCLVGEYREVTTPGKWLQKLGLCSIIMSFEQGVIPAMTLDLSLQGFIWIKGHFVRSPQAREGLTTV